MKKLIIAYLLVLLTVAVIFGINIYCGSMKIVSAPMALSIYCSILGLLGGIVHCLRAFYLHNCLLKNWQADWELWYFVRPIVSGIMGFISMVFIKGGLLAFSSDSTNIADDRIVLYLAIAFLAGYNVQNFLKKIDEISKSFLGIDKKDYPDNNLK